MRVVVSNFKSLFQIFDRQIEVALVVVALSSMHEELGVFNVHFDCLVKINKCLFVILESQATLGKAVRNTCVSFVSIVPVKWVVVRVFIHLALSEVFFGVMERLDCQFANSSTIVPLAQFRVDFNALVEVIDRQLVVAHVLIYNSTRNVHCFV